MDYTRLKISVRDQVGHIELAKPDEYNRMSPAFWTEFPQAVSEMDESGSVRALVISAQGKHFSAGMDVANFTDAAPAETLDTGRQGERDRRDLMGLQDAFSAIEQVRMPVIAAVQGACVGGGLDLASACDIRYCTADAFFCIQEINIAIAADAGTLQRLPWLIPEGLMRELAYTGRRLVADEAQTVGLVNAVYPTQQQMLESVMSIAGEIATKSPLAITSTKQILNYGRAHSIRETLDYQLLLVGALPPSADIQTYFSAKADGVEPQYGDLPRRPTIVGQSRF